MRFGARFGVLTKGSTIIHVPAEYAVDGKTKVDPRFRLPKSLWIVGAMNSSDRSVAPLDAAMRRRFSIIAMPPDYAALRRHLGPSAGTPPADSTAWSPDDVRGLAVSLLEKLNERLEAVLGQDFLLGQSNVWHVEGQTQHEVVSALTRAVDERIVPTLRMMFTDNDDALAVVLLAGESDPATSPRPDRLCYWWKPSENLGSFGYARLRFNPLTDMDSVAALSELRRLAGA